MYSVNRVWPVLCLFGLLFILLSSECAKALPNGNEDFGRDDRGDGHGHGGHGGKNSQWQPPSFQAQINKYVWLLLYIDFYSVNESAPQIYNSNDFKKSTQSWV